VVRFELAPGVEHLVLLFLYNGGHQSGVEENPPLIPAIQTKSALTCERGESVLLMPVSTQGVNE